MGKESACNAGDPGSNPGSRRSPGEGNGKPTAVLLSGKSHGQKSLVGYSPWHLGREESDTTGAIEHACYNSKLVLTDADCPQVFIYFMYRIFIKEKTTFFGKKGSQENVDVMAGRERQLIGHSLNCFSGR